MLLQRNSFIIGAISFTLVLAPVKASAQFDGLGDVLLKGLNDALGQQATQRLMKLQAELMTRGLKFDSMSKVMPAGAGKISFTVTNTYKDTAHYSIKILRDSLPRLVFPDENSDSAKGTPDVKKDDKEVPAEKPKRPMVIEEENASDVKRISYKDLTPYLAIENLVGTLAPGQSKTFTISIKPGSDISAGAYAAWVVSTVEIQPVISGKSKGNDSTSADANARFAGVKVNSFAKILLDRK